MTIDSSPTGDNATGTATIFNGKVIQTTITYPGSGYTQAPSITLNSATCGGGTGAVIPQVAVSSGTGFPKNLWSNELLRVYFNDMTIGQMRIHYCSKAYAQNPASVHPKCWGYLAVGLNNYTYIPMSVPGRS